MLPLGDRDYVCRVHLFYQVKQMIPCAAFCYRFHTRAFDGTLVGDIGGWGSSGGGPSDGESIEP